MDQEQQLRDQLAESKVKLAHWKEQLNRCDAFSLQWLDVARHVWRFEDTLKRIERALNETAHSE